MRVTVRKSSYVPRDFLSPRYEVFIQRENKSVQWPNPPGLSYGFSPADARVQANRLAEVLGATVEVVE